MNRRAKIQIDKKCRQIIKFSDMHGKKTQCTRACQICPEYTFEELVSCGKYVCMRQCVCLFVYLVFWVECSAIHTHRQAGTYNQTETQVPERHRASETLNQVRSRDSCVCVGWGREGGDGPSVSTA